MKRFIKGNYPGVDRCCGIANDYAPAHELPIVRVPERIRNHMHADTSPETLPLSDADAPNSLENDVYRGIAVSVSPPIRPELQIASPFMHIHYLLFPPINVPHHLPPSYSADAPKTEVVSLKALRAMQELQKEDWRVSLFFAFQLPFSHLTDPETRLDVGELVDLSPFYLLASKTGEDMQGYLAIEGKMLRGLPTLLGEDTGQEKLESLLGFHRGIVEPLLR